MLKLLQIVCCITVLLQCNGANSVPRKSDPQADLENMADTPQLDPTIIPAHLVMHEDPLIQDDTPGDPLNPNDFHQAEEIGQLAFDEAVQGDPIMMAGLFQGDIQIRSDDELFRLTAHTAALNITPNNAINDNKSKWSGGVIPYVISSSYTSSDRAVIAKAMNAYHQKTCIQFAPRRSEQDYIHITKGSGCSSAVGRAGGRQTVSLSDGCVYFGVVIHELMHAVGFWHEQSRADRDSYIQIVWSNIQSGMDYNFQKYDWNIIQSLGVSYDTGSIMHYGEKAFARDRSRATIIPKNGQKIGQRDDFSRVDTDKINKLYECRGSGSGGGGGGGTTVTVAPKPPPPVPVPDKCIDSSEHCKYWAGKGECAANPTWMKANCQLSCKTCGKCEDGNQHCSAWAARGECKRSPSYMDIHCKKSCGLCDKAVPSAICKDENVHCEAWATLGECDVNPRYMKKSCRRSCKTC